MLVTNDGATIYDSSVIVEHVDAISPVGRLIPEPGRQRIQVKRWEALADGLMEATVLSVLETRWPAKEQSRACVERQMGKVNQGLRVASHDLAEKSWCAGESYTLADIALGCALGYLDLRFADFDWRAQHPKLKRHAGKLFKRPPFEATEPRDPPVA